MSTHAYLRVADLSTVHLPGDLAVPKDAPVYAEFDFGWFVYVPDAQFLAPEHAKWLHDVRAWMDANSLRTENWVRFDSAGQIVDLPEYESLWT